MIGDEAAVELLRGLCAVPSVSGQEAAAVAFMVEQAMSAGLTARVDEAGSFVAERGEGDTLVVLLGHIDTVEGFIPPRVEDGVLHGRGAVDAKGPLAAFLVAATRCEPPDNVRIVVLGAVEEEAPTSKGAHAAARRYTPDFVVIGEPSGADAVTLGYKGRVGLRLRARRPHAHSAAASPTVAADAVRFWSAVEAHCERLNAGRRVFDRVDPHLGRFQTSTDGFEDLVEVDASFRLPVGYSSGDLEADLQALAAGWASAETHDAVQAFRAEKRTPLVRAFLQSLRERSLEPRFTLKTGTSDMNVVGPVWRCPIVAYGPGDSSLDHAPDERIEVSEYLTAIGVVTGVLERLGR